MNVFWIIALVGLAVLLIGLLFDGVLELGGLVPDAGGWISLPVLGGFAAVFGFTGALVTATGLPALIALAAALAAGVLAARGAVVLTRALASSDSGGASSRDELSGLTATVVSDIPVDGYGEVNAVLAGTHIKLSARSEGRALPRGTDVLILSPLSDSAVLVREL